MPVLRTYQCPDCEGFFEYLHTKWDEPPPEFCQLCKEWMGEVEPELPQVNIGKAQTKAVDAVADDYMKHHKVSDLNDGLRVGDVAAKPVKNVVTDYMQAAQAAGAMTWGSPQAMLGGGATASGIAKPSVDTIESSAKPKVSFKKSKVSFMILQWPNKKKFLKQSLELMEDCMMSASNRAAQARSLKRLRYTGTMDGQPVIYNRMNGHINKLGAYLFSPADLRFFLEFENEYDENILEMGAVAAKKLTRKIEQQNIDKKFQSAVDLCLTYGAGIYKVMWTATGIKARLPMPWNIGVYREDENDLDEQEAICERIYLSKEEFWRRISHLENRVELFKRAMAYTKKAQRGEASDTYLTQVIMASNGQAVETNGLVNTQTPGGLVSLSDPLGLMLSPESGATVLVMYEIAVLDDETQDYTTIQIVEPDIIITPFHKKRNLFLHQEQPYGLVQANPMEGYIWGRSEMADLITLQDLLSERLNDIKKLSGMQFDRLLAFVGFSGMNDDKYDTMRENGWIANDEPVGKIEDLTPKMPEDAWHEVEAIIKMMDDVGGFGNILSGQGEPGVRAGNHAQTLLRTASPPLRDRALLVERQCAEMGDKIFKLMQAKQPDLQWTHKGTEFLLSQLPDDTRVVVDSHSSSPIYEEDHLQLASFLAKVGAIDKESILDMVSFPMKETVKIRVRNMQQKAEAEREKLLKEHPEVAAKMMGEHSGHKHA